MNSPRTDTRQILLLGLIALLLIAVGAGGGFTRVDRIALDGMLALHAQARQLPADIVVIDIDQKSLEDMNAAAGSWPWPRAVHGELIEALRQAQPKAIVFDLLLNEADTFRPESDEYFSAVVAAAPDVYLPTMLLADGSGAAFSRYPPAMRLEATANANPHAHAPLLVPLIVPPDSWRGGLVNFNADGDGIGRRYWLYREVAGWRIPSMPKRLADDLGWAMPDGDHVVLHWYRDQLPQRHSYSDVYNDLTGSAPTLADSLRGRIVIIGASAPGLGDLRPTPIRSTFPGVALLATAIGNLAHGDWLTDSHWGLLLYPLLLLPLVLAFQRRISPLRIGVGLAALTLLLAALEFVLLAKARLIVHAISPVAAAWLLFLALALISWWEERRQREQAVTIFGRFLDRRVVDQLISGGTIASAQATQAREITLLFSDIRGFTTMSERSTPEQIVELLNEYFSRQVQVIFQTQGTLDKFIGDAIMAFWGAPASDPQHAVHAVEAALQMVDVLDRFRKDFDAPPDFDVGIGVHTGPAVVGFIGSHDRLDYTAIGDSVNLASRIEGATKGKARILVSEFTVQACGDAFDFIDHGIVHVKGREQGVRLYEPKRKTAGSPAAGGA
ncbi:MAG: CHASE2 domain-containing protein [Pseudomonadota bacterium]